MPWESAAACRALPQGFIDANFYADRGSGPAGERAARGWERAREICLGCPVQPDCLATALGANYTVAEGVWGGTTPPERLGALRRVGWVVDPDRPAAHPTLLRRQLAFRELQGYVTAIRLLRDREEVSA